MGYKSKTCSKLEAFVDTVMAKTSYKDSGVDLDVYAESMSRLPRLLRRTHSPRVLLAEGGFAGLFQLDFSDGLFDWAISTSMIEHLHPEDVDNHLREVRRVLKTGGNYLIWCPNGLGHHDDRDVHLTMLSYREWVEKLTRAGFRRFRSTMTSRLPVIDARWKIFLERLLLLSHLNIMWSHLGVRNVLLVTTK